MPSKTKKNIPKERATVKVVWYNRLKGFGEGITKDGRYVFLHFTAMNKDQDKVNLEIGKEYGANLTLEDGRLIAYSIWNLRPKSKVAAQLRKIEAKLTKIAKEIQLTWYSDPGHAWLEVPEDLYKQSGIKASPYSYYSKNRKMYYLEEDVDAGLFLEAMEEKGMKVHTKEVNEPHSDSFVRNLSHLKHASKKWYAHDSRHSYVLNLGLLNSQEDAQKALFDRVVGNNVHGWDYNEKELQKAINEGGVYLSHNPIH